MALMTFVVVTSRCGGAHPFYHVQCAACFVRQDMLKAGCTLAQILRAGQWRSAAFMKYLDEMELEKDLAFELGIHSDTEEWVD